MSFDPNTAINAVLSGTAPAPASAGGGLPPESQALVNIMLANLTANNANPDAVEAYRDQRDAERAAAAAPAAPAGPIGMGPYGQP